MTAEDWPARRSRIVRDSLGVGIATGVYGAGFGALSVASGLTVWQTCVLSLVMFTGASQFALIGVAASGGAASAAATALLLGTRNTLYGLRMAPMLGWTGWRRAAAAHVLIDESTAMAVTRADRAGARVGFLTTGVSVLVVWNLFTLIGALAGDAIGDPRRLGLDAAVAAAFLGLLWPRLAVSAHRAVGLAAAALAVLLVPLVPAGVPVLAAGGVALLAALLRPGEPPAPEPPPAADPSGGLA